MLTSEDRHNSHHPLYVVDSSDDDKKKKSNGGGGVGGVASISYQLNFEQASQTLVVTILECRSQKK